jgi:hypothetical protein
MTPWINAIGLTTLLTALFAMRYRFWRSPKVLAAYFGFFLVIELVVSHWVLPPDALGPELGIVCLFVAVLVCAAIYGLNWYEKSTGEDH